MITTVVKLFKDTGANRADYEAFKVTEKEWWTAFNQRILQLQSRLSQLEPENPEPEHGAGITGSKAVVTTLKELVTATQGKARNGDDVHCCPTCKGSLPEIRSAALQVVFGISERLPRVASRLGAPDTSAVK